MTTSEGDEDVSIGERIARLEAALVEQEHRPIQVIRNALEYCRSDESDMRASSRKALAIFIVSLIVLGGGLSIPFYTSFYALYLQKSELEEVRADLRQTDAIERYNMWVDFAEDANVASVRRFPTEFIEEHIYKKRYADSDEAVERFLQMYRYYVYLVYCVESGTIKGRGVDYRLWLKGLLDYQEFLDVHCTHGQYYPDLARLIEEIEPSWRSRGSDYSVCLNADYDGDPHS